MAPIKTIAEWMAERGLALADLVDKSGIEKRIVVAVVAGRYTPSPVQRQQLATTLAVGVDQIAWGHVTQVSHVQGHGPQFGRSP
jgi:hypothetical protein